MKMRSNLFVKWFDPESGGGTVSVRLPDDMADSLEALNAFCRAVKRRCVASRIDYKLISTADYMDAALLSFLAARHAARRKTGAKR